MSVIKVGNKEIETTNKTVLDILVEAFDSVQMKIVDFEKLENMLTIEFKKTKLQQ